MNDVAIRVENLSKRYRIGLVRQRYHTLRDEIADSVRSLFHRNGRSHQDPGTFWALKDVSFDIRQGEVVGIIGRNGAGKSTLLKILSRITEPTKGRAMIRGRVGSLLEVGTGFHAELSGRENIYLNGAILGMKKAEIDRKFDEIVAFAEVEDFIDTPVKRYSSGMHVRLAFAVAAHLEPEIIIVDEVLAVGDVAFQRKCLGKMGDVSREGRTVIFVSHNMMTVQTLCSRGILLANGTVIMDGNMADAVNTYLRTLEQNAGENIAEWTDRRGRGHVRLLRVEICAGDARPSATLVTGRPARFIFYVSGIQPQMSCIFTLYEQHGLPVTFFSSALHGPEDSHDPTMGAKFVCDVDELPLVPGRYRINVAIVNRGELEDHLETAAFFDVEQGQLRGRPIRHSNQYGNVCLQHRWIVPVQ
jgi:homopolymeric O-antigen transport system ATP-binding protein